MTSGVPDDRDGMPGRVERRRRIRRATAFGGLLATVGLSVALRSATGPPAPRSALATGQARTSPPVPAGSPLVAPPPSPPAPAVRGPAVVPVPTAGAPVSRTVTGAGYEVGYGVVQVRATVQGGRLTDVSAVSLPRGGRSSSISAYAAPRLRQEALAAQGANIDSVSGATYTSAGYARSLQSALDQARS